MVICVWKQRGMDVWPRLPVAEERQDQRFPKGISAAELFIKLASRFPFLPSLASSHFSSLWLCWSNHGLAFFNGKLSLALLFFHFHLA
jgi:hypothetical protein